MYSEILLPLNAPLAFGDRQTLVDKINESEIRSDARTARQIKMALPIELNLEEQIGLIKGYINDNFVKLGMVAVVAIHQGSLSKNSKSKDIDPVNERKDNPHAHVILTTRKVDENGFNKLKSREWDKKEYLIMWRKQWADAQNREFERKGLDVQVSHESYAARGIKRLPTKHIGLAAMAMENKGVKTERGDIHRKILAQNKKIIEKKQKMKRERDYGLTR